MTGGPSLRPGVPWYVHPVEAPRAWQLLGERFAEADGIADGFVVVNVHNGPGEEDDPYYGTALGRLRSAAPGLAVLGYVDVDYGRRGIHQVLTDVADWRRRYGVHGFMLDRFPSGDVSGHRQATDVALEMTARLRESGAHHVVGNPGVVPMPEVREALDITCEFEGTGLEYLSSAPSGGPGRWHLVHSCRPGEVQAVRAAAESLGVGHGHFTEGELPHPWGWIASATAW